MVQTAKKLTPETQKTVKLLRNEINRIDRMPAFHCPPSMIYHRDRMVKKLNLLLK